MPSKQNGLRKWLSLYATGLAMLVVLFVGVYLVQESGGLGSREARFSLGLNLIASALFTIAFSVLASWVLEKNQRESIEETLQTSLGQALTHISSLNAKYLPCAEYPSSDTFGEPFNRMLMASIEGSKIYDFSGPSPRFVAARLKMIRRPPEEVRVAMIDPSLSSSVMRRAADREKWASSTGKSLAELEAAFRKELVMAVVALFDYRTTCPVRIVYTNDTVVYRMELTDTDIFFSWYHGPSSSGKEMPEAAQFGEESLLYRVIRQEMTRRFEVYPRKVAFDSSHTDSDLLAHLRELTGSTVADEALADLRSRYPPETAGLTTFLKGLGY